MKDWRGSVPAVGGPVTVRCLIDHTKTDRL